MHKRVIIGGGGTGGHVFPAISIADALKKLDPGMEILFVGAIRRLEMEKVPAAGYKITGLPVTGFKRRISLDNILFFWNLCKSMRMARQIIKEFKPDVVLGVGGYASGPICRVASRSGIPVIIQEQNSYAGVTNRILGLKAMKICVAYEGMEKYFPEKKILLTGNPVRQDILNCNSKKTEGLEHFGLNLTDPVVLILGGSLGARTINEAVLNSLRILPGNIQFIWQTGKGYFHEANESTKRSGKQNIHVFPFISEMDLAYGCSDIVISRAGAGTISELAVAGKPSILVPSPNVAEDHQMKNALALIQKEAALLVKDEEAAGKLISEIINLINNAEQQRKLSENIMRLAIPDAADKIANVLINT